MLQFSQYSSNFLTWASFYLYTPHADAASQFPTPDHCMSNDLQICFADIFFTIHMYCQSEYSVEWKMKHASTWELRLVWCKLKFIPDNPHNVDLYTARVVQLVR